jgi:6-phosphogluconolactonase
MNIDRHSLLLLLLVALLNGPQIASAKTYLMYVGTYTDGESKGIYAYRYDSSAGELNEIGLAAETRNPSFLAASPDGKLLYAVNEVSDYEGKSSGAVTAFAIDHATGKLTKLNQVASRGADPCYISFDKTGKFALVANYTGGSVATFPVLGDGRVGESSAFIQHAGKGPDAKRQEGPHAHWIETTADNRFAVAVDLGLDELLVYHFDPATGALRPNDPPFAKTEPGAGPRHLAFGPGYRFAYAVDELNSTVTAFTYQAGSFKPVQAISTLPEHFAGGNDTAEIHAHPNGKFLYASNRGHDSVAVFAIDNKTGRLRQAGDFPTQGKSPRNFELDPGGRLLFAANQKSGNIVVFRVDQKTGALTPTGQVLKVPSPVAVKFVAQ